MHKDDNLIQELEKIVSEEFQIQNIKGESIVLHKQDIKPCLGCFKCWVQTPGVCIIDDYAREVAKKMIQADNLVYITPINYGGYSSELKKALDRSICLIMPFFRIYENEIHHETRYDSYPNLIVIGTLEESDPVQEEIFTSLVKRNVLNLFNPKHNSQVIYHSDEESTIKKKVENALSIVGDNNV